MSWHSRDSPLRGTSCSSKKRTIPGTNPSPSAILRTPSSCRDCTIDLAACQHLGHQKPTEDRQRGFRMLIKMEKAFCDLQLQKQPRLFQFSMSWHSRDSPLRGTSCSSKQRTIPGTNPSPSAILGTPSSVSNDRGRPRFKRTGRSGKHSEGGLRISD
ncbi:hypothetical protein CDAR_174651 [Caerostris darwini]|uniref:Uncharacterized protein n=1 Tax=Caerostris darwini TaxID=1538125 RepID=A0AAV4VCH8_9ARAC|nr:hypothetical protein CDAR_174651 [Caerostris darwini]